MADTKTPKRFSEGELKKVGVKVIDKKTVRLECERCGQQWSPNLLSGGDFPRGYWKCPEGCNT